MRTVEAVDLLEEAAAAVVAGLETRDGVVRFEVGPFQVVTLRVDMG